MGISGANAIEEGWSEESILVIIIGVERQIAKRGGRLYDGDIHNQRKPQHLELVCLKKILIKEKCIKKCMKVSILQIDRDIFIFDIIIVIFILFLNVWFRILEKILKLQIQILRLYKLDKILKIIINKYIHRKVI